ncbi:MAG TPA: ABC transporter substrate-binding protein, partial [Anaeromyxobacter sp.]
MSPLGSTLLASPIARTGARSRRYPTGEPTFIYESTDFGNSVSAAGKAYAQAKGLKIVGEESYQKGAADYRSTLTKMKAAGPDLVFMVS